MRLFHCAALLCAVASVAAAPASRPSVSTHHDMMRVTLDYNRRTLAGAYDAVGQHDPKWDAAAHAVLERMAVRYTDFGFGPLYDSGTTDTDTNESLLALAEAAKNCPDPLVGYCRASLYRATRRMDDYLKLLRDVAPKIIDGPYPLYRRMAAANAMAERFPDEPQWATKRSELAVPLLLEKTPDPRDRRVVLDRVIEMVWNNGETFKGQLPNKGADRQPLIDALAADPNADPWVLNMLRGYHEIAYAWEFRGSGWAASVTPEGWAGFGKHIALARKALTAAYEAEPNYPEAPAEMCTVCMAESVDAREWFDRAITAQVDYMGAWWGYASSLQPRWGGSMKSLFDLGREAVKTGRFDTVTPYFLEDVLGMMRNENNAGDTIWRVPGVWAALDEMYDGYLTALPRGLDVPWNGSRRAAYAWRCGQYAEAKRTLDTLGEQVNAQAFDSFGVDFAEAHDEVYARTGPIAKEVQKLDVQETLKRYGAAADGYDKLAAGLGKDDPSRPFCVRRGMINRMLQSLADGKPTEVPLTGPDALLAWRGDTKGWQAADGMLTFGGEKEAWSRLTHMVPLPEDCRVRVEWSWSGPAKDASETGPEFDLIVRDTAREGFIYAAVVPKHQRILVKLGEKYGIGYRGGPGDPVMTPANDWHTLTVRRAGDSVAVEQDGQTLIESTENDWLQRGKPVLGLVGRSGVGETTIRVRKIVIEPGT